MTVQCVGHSFRTDGKYLGRAYKEHLNDFGSWSQKAHAGERMLLEEISPVPLNIITFMYPKEFL